MIGAGVGSYAKLGTGKSESETGQKAYRGSGIKRQIGSGYQEIRIRCQPGYRQQLKSKVNDKPGSKTVV